jgi:hypothetical protein
MSVAGCAVWVYDVLVFGYIWLCIIACGGSITVKYERRLQGSPDGFWCKKLMVSPSICKQFKFLKYIRRNSSVIVFVL